MILKSWEDLVKISLKIFLKRLVEDGYIDIKKKTHIFNSQKDEYHIFLDEKLS